MADLNVLVSILVFTLRDINIPYNSIPYTFIPRMENIESVKV
ncbi:hypothetical protein Ab1vBOLIVR5_gp142 [Agrobacterium phage OLIVR5]|uniref:Uncharacterized protein n=2 Tax=Caudoviricetes TaxID=2731619 RepID=A0A858MV21_9CAUD|nr:hypothetical protein KNU99_gp259 [Agrobacterium phage OLIVR5]QIW87790.1 hypothetical protein Ab1vBOLIVR5_gp142 [Agrobacterium phage OLIVR5]QIW88055.1 hypothetical protein Ab1vBOLIVR6_gp148 [Agrobacterium phage OLIVR6]